MDSPLIQKGKRHRFSEDSKVFRFYLSRRKAALLRGVSPWRYGGTHLGSFLYTLHATKIAIPNIFFTHHILFREAIVLLHAILILFCASLHLGVSSRYSGVSGIRHLLRSTIQSCSEALCLTPKVVPEFWYSGGHAGTPKSQKYILKYINIHTKILTSILC